MDGWVPLRFTMAAVSSCWLLAPSLVVTSNLATSVGSSLGAGCSMLHIKLSTPIVLVRAEFFRPAFGDELFFSSQLGNFFVSISSWCSPAHFPGRPHRQDPAVSSSPCLSWNQRRAPGSEPRRLRAGWTPYPQGGTTPPQHNVAKEIRCNETIDDRKA